MIVLRVIVLRVVVFRMFVFRMVFLKEFGFRWFFAGFRVGSMGDESYSDWGPRTVFSDSDLPPHLFI